MGRKNSAIVAELFLMVLLEAIISRPLNHEYFYTRYKH